MLELDVQKPRHPPGHRCPATVAWCLTLSLTSVSFICFKNWSGSEHMNGCKEPNPVTHSRRFINPIVPVLRVPFGVIDVGV